MEHVNTIVVPSGAYHVAQQSPLKLEAYLGTCVGVAIHDKVTGVGGLLHLLLPEQPLQGSRFQPEKYAATGLPLFIRALENAGAHREQMVATVAGGAFIGPLMAYDLQLDIGGRTFDRVTDFLESAKIPIDQCETGGFFTSRLCIDLRNGQCMIEPAGQSQAAKYAEVNLPDLKAIHKAIERIQPIPQVALKLLRMIEENQDDYRPISREILKDQVIMARTLKLCNSALYTKKSPIESLEHALIFLGRQVFAKNVLAAYVRDFFEDSNRGYSLCRGGIYHHAIGTAILAEKLARLTGLVTPTLAYTGGLLHDIGKVVLDQYIASSLPLFYRALQKDVNFLEAEKKHLKTTHTEVGSLLALKWSLPNPLTDIIRHHHDPENSKDHPELVHLVFVADLLMARFYANFELERLNTDRLSARFAKIGLTLDRLQELVDLIPTGMVEDFS